MVHRVKTLQKFKWCILSKHDGDSSGTFCQNTKETQVVHPVKALQNSKKVKWLKESQVVHSVKTLRKVQWLILSKH